MEVKINDEFLSEEIQKTISQAIADALKGWSVRDAIAKVITDEVASGAVGEAIKRSLDRIDKEEIVKILAVELTNAVASGTVMILKEGLLDVLYKIRGLSDYRNEDKQEKEKLRSLFFDLSKKNYFVE
jgi:hypothetical protein